MSDLVRFLRPAAPVVFLVSDQSDGEGPFFVVEPMHHIAHDGIARCPVRVEGKRIDAFADLIAEGLSVSSAARSVGATPRYGNAMMQRLRAKFGWQAA